MIIEGKRSPHGFRVNSDPAWDLYDTETMLLAMRIEEASDIHAVAMPDLLDLADHGKSDGDGGFYAGNTAIYGISPEEVAARLAHEIRERDKAIALLDSALKASETARKEASK